MFKPIISSLVLILASCVMTQKKEDQFLNRSPQSEAVESAVPINRSNQDLYGKLVPLFTTSKDFRTFSEEFLINAQADKKKGNPIESKKTVQLHDEGRKYLELRRQLLEVVSLTSSFVDQNTIKVSGAERSEDINASSGKVHLLSPLDERGKNTLFQIKISLAAALILYDNFILGIYPYYENDDFRYKLVFDASNTTALKEIVQSFQNKKNREILAKAINIYRTDIQVRKDLKYVSSNKEEFLDEIILNSYFFNFALKDGLASDPWGDQKKFNRYFVRDQQKSLSDFFTFSASQIFGNIAGAVKIKPRDGKLKNLEQTAKQHILETLRPFDILLEKTPFKATDQFIPGYFGHVAIWLGTEEQLQKEGLWDSLPKEHQDRVKKKRYILEALRFNDNDETLKRSAGVQLNTLDHFLDIDDLLVLRLKNKIPRELKSRYFKNAIDQIGKDYDFNFDVETKNKIVCSELIYVVFDNISWPTKKALGRFTISPDNILEQAMPGKLFEPVLMFRDGNEVLGDLDIELQRTLNENYVPLHIPQSFVLHSTEPQEMTLLTSGLASLKKRIDMIRQAQDSIDLEYFIFQDDQDRSARLVTQELIKKVKQKSRSNPQKNISVRVLVDNSFTVKKLDDAIASALRDAGIQVRYYNTAGLSEAMLATVRNHRKLIVVDGKQAITGGRNIGDEYFDLRQDFNFLDTDIYIKGSMVSALKSSFEAYWYNPISADPNYVTAKEKEDKHYKKKIEKGLNLLRQNETDKEFLPFVESMGESWLKQEYTGVCSKTTIASDLPGTGVSNRKTFSTIVETVKGATTSIDIESPYFVLTQVGESLFAGIKQASPSIKINVQTNSIKSSDAIYVVAAFYESVIKWISGGLNFWIYKGEEPTYMAVPQYKKKAVWGVHSKRAVLDGKTTLIGTFNVDPRSARLNNEMVFICHDNPEFAAVVLRDMYARRAQSALLKKDAQPEVLKDKNGNVITDDYGIPYREYELFEGSNGLKNTLYYIFKPLMKFPIFREQI